MKHTLLYTVVILYSANSIIGMDLTAKPGAASEKTEVTTVARLGEVTRRLHELSSERTQLLFARAQEKFAEVTKVVPHFADLAWPFTHSDCSIEDHIRNDSTETTMTADRQIGTDGFYEKRLVVIYTTVARAGKMLEYPLIIEHQLALRPERIQSPQEE